MPDVNTLNGTQAPAAAPPADPAPAAAPGGITAGEAVMAVCCLAAALLLAGISIDVLRSGRRRDDAPAAPGE